MDQERAGRQLGLIAGVLEAARDRGVPLWLRGGWAMDFFLGEVTRDHGDIDWFARAGDARVLADVLARLGHTPVPGPPADLQLDFVKDALDSSFTLVDTDAAGRVTVAGGPWAGTPWPDGMLGTEPGRIGALEAPIVDPRVQIEIKRMMPVWDPSRPRRAKDAEDIARLEAALRLRKAG
ncbi:aminoglycoside adenylyltransferase [Streptomyces sp. 5-8]|uniref:Aminoglycoside adenylyltransferase n=1 Tax=Streptomyces musisoli TaxID=2802280 RepID=A0ABS1P5U7_9ACTN|nr:MULTISPECIES: aminoglycoside adenylyltransferase [Streptomyces]MBL1107683.1 aminoglycoside adenylyltransferase [Streptomyces musisoli]MBY8845870.1 aminoglycoside adenylyltransferase [Streptomyces sp. SP2-10]